MNKKSQKEHHTAKQKKTVSSKQPETVKNIIQAKLHVTSSDDSHEKQADQVADHLLTISDQALASASFQPQPIQKISNTNTLQQKSNRITPEITPKINSQIQSLTSGGQALNDQDRSFFEPRFNHDFSQVRIHNDQGAHQAARSINAKAFTIGQHIAFDAGEFNTNSTEGKRLMAHELTHVIQQNGEQTIQREDRTILTLEEFYPLIAQINTQNTGFHHLPKVAEDITTDYIRPDFNLGDQVKVLGKTPLNWLKVERQLDTKTQVGYVDWRYVDIIKDEQSLKDESLKAPWQTDVVKKLLQMSDSGQKVLKILENDTKLRVCDDIQATKFDLTIINSRANELSASKLFSMILDDKIIPVETKTTNTQKPTFNGSTNRQEKTSSIQKDLSNFEAASTLRHEIMHITFSEDVSRGMEEKMIKDEVSVWRAGMEKLLGFSQEDKDNTDLPDSSLPKEDRDKAVDDSQHYTPKKQHIHDNQFVITVYAPRPVKPVEFKGFKKP